jgi:hypothetical protein
LSKYAAQYSTYPDNPDCVAGRRFAHREPGRSGIAWVRLLQTGDDGITLEMSVPEYRLTVVEEEGGQVHRLAIPDGTNSTGPGQPALPLLSALVGVPAGAKLAPLEILLDDSSPLPGEYRLQTALQPATATDDFQPGGWLRVVDQGREDIGSLYPETPARLAGSAWLRDQRVVRVEFSPFQYYPGAGR